MKRIMIVAIALVLALVCCVGSVSATVPPASDIDTTVITGTVVGSSITIVPPGAFAWTLDRSNPSDNQVNIGNVVISTGGTGWQLEVCADSNDGRLAFGSALLTNRAKIYRSGDSTWYELRATMLGLASAATTSDSVPIILSQHIEPGDPDGGPFTITLTFTGTTL